jgi:aminoglycoside phosphotransferase (APT) family kinase protein
MADLDPWMILQALGCSDALLLDPVSGGSDTLLWRVQTRSGTFALRVFPPGRTAQMEREIAVMQCAADAGISVPRLYATGVWHDRAALLLAWVPGRPLYEALRTQPWRAWSLGCLFGVQHAAIHAVTAPSVLREQPDAWIAWAGDNAASVQAHLKRLDLRRDALLHLDYHPLNVMTDGARITGVLDWTNARAGDPRADTARTLTILRLDYTGGGPRLALERGVRRLFELGWRHGYGRAHTPDDLALFYAWAGAVMERDLASKRTAKDLARIHRWTMRWARRGGCA